jgi:hypothetical protein
MIQSNDSRTEEDCERRLDDELAGTFPASDPPSIVQPRRDVPPASPSEFASGEAPRRGSSRRATRLLADALEWLAARLRARA